MRLHLPKGLLAALLAACFAAVPMAEAESNKVVTNNGTTAIELPNQSSSPDRLLFDATGSTAAVITYNGTISSEGTHWCGPGKDVTTTPVYNDNAAASYYIKLLGGISGSGTLKFNEMSNQAGRNAIWELGGTNTYTGSFEVNHGGEAKSYAQLTLSGTFSGSNVVTLANSMTILHVASDVSLGGLLDAENKPVGAVTAIVGKTLTLNISGDAKTYSGSIGTGSYFTETAYTANAPTTVSAAVNLTKTGTGTQNLNGTNKFGTLKVDAGTLGLGGATTLTGATTVSSGATLSNTGNLTNNGSLAISGIYSGNTIKQEGSGTISLASGAVVNLDRLDIERVDLTDTDANGTHAYNRKYMLVSSGTATAASGVTYRIDGAAVDGTFSDGSYKLTATNTYYNIANGSVTYSGITAENQPTFDFIRVAGDGALVADRIISHDLVSSGGSVKVSGTGITYSGNMDLAQDTNLTITKNDGVDAADVTINGSISGGGGLIISGGVTAKLGTVNSFTGGITIQSGSTLKLSGNVNKEYCGDGGNSVTVEREATFDLNGTHSQERLPQVTLKGGTLQNSGGDISTAYRQLGDITLTEDSKINAAANFGIIKSYYAAASINLGSNNTLTKVGSGQFDASSTSVTGTGKIRIKEGIFNFHRSDGTKQACSLEDGVGIELAGGDLSGAFETKGKSEGTSTTVPVVTIHGEENGTVSSAITNKGTLKVTSEAEKVVTFSGVITNGADSAVLQIGDTTAEGTAISGTAKLTAALGANAITTTVGKIKVLSGSSLILDGANVNGDYTGTITVYKGGKMLSKNNTHDNIVNGVNGKFVLDGEFAIESTGANYVNGISGSGVVKTAQNATLNIVCEASGGTSTLDESGTTTPTSYTSAFSGSVEASGSAKTVSLVFTGPSDATGDTPGSSGTTVSLESLSATNGSTLNVKGIAEATNTTGGLSVSELVIGTGSKVQAWGSGNTWDEATEATVLMKGADGSPVTLTVGTAGQAGTSILNANLVLDGATVTLNNALTMGSTLTLNNVNLINWDALVAANAGGGPIVLFTSVDSLTLGSGDSAFEAEAGTEYAASKAFSNTNMDNYKLQIVGSPENYTVQMVKSAPTPEPTTATLSLLALMGLAARRRRKA